MKLPPQRFATWASTKHNPPAGKQSPTVGVDTADKQIDVRGVDAALKLRAERRAGELLATMHLHGGNRGNQHTGGKVAECDLANLGINKTQSSRWQSIASIPDDDFERPHTRPKTVK